MNPLTNIKSLTTLIDNEIKLGRVGTKASWHEQYRSSAWCFFGGLPFELTEGDIICIFSQYGEIVNLNLIRDRKTGKSKGFGFVCYENQKSTDLCVDNFNGTKILERMIRVDHVLNYKPPKDSDEIDDMTKFLREEGCAPAIMADKKDKIQEILVKKSEEELRVKKEKSHHSSRDDHKRDESYRNNDRDRNSRNVERERSYRNREKEKYNGKRDKEGYEKDRYSSSNDRNLQSRDKYRDARDNNRYPEKRPSVEKKSSRRHRSSSSSRSKSPMTSKYSSKSKDEKSNSRRSRSSSSSLSSSRSRSPARDKYRDDRRDRHRHEPKRR